MKTVDQMIQKNIIWAGLNRSSIGMEDADVVVFGIPYP